MQLNSFVLVKTVIKYSIFICTFIFSCNFHITFLIQLNIQKSNVK